MPVRPILLLLTIFVFIAAGASLSSADAASLAGPARVIDGDTIAIGRTHIRLLGIDAPETDQTCIGKNSQRYSCGLSARAALRKLIDGRPLACVGDTKDVYGRRLMTCSVAGKDINRAMVADGWALAFLRYSRDYVAEERRARKRGVGLWAGAFIAPWDWRHRGTKTEILGAVIVPTNAQAMLLPASPETNNPVPGCVIKGNISRHGDRIYHLPGMRDYARTRISESKGERWFCSEREAQAAGWRKAVR
jgi:endonuclease YncB( thermonuclease family)